MKRHLIASILGIAASVASSSGQGHIVFDTYVSSIDLPYAAVLWGDTSANPAPGHVLGRAVSLADGFSAELYYGLGSGLSFNQLTPLPSSITPVGLVGIDGYVIGNIVTLPDWTSGPVTFGISAWNGPSYGLGTYESQNNITWTDSNVVGTGSLANYFDAYQLATAYPNGIIVNAVPEPGTSALAGLGAAAALASRRGMRRKVKQSA